MKIAIRVRLLLLILLSAPMTGYAADNAAAAGGVCEYVALTANQGKLRDVALKGHAWNDAAFPTPADLGSGGVVFRDRFDINNDGRPEYVYVTSQGTAHFEALAIYDADLRPMEFSTSPDDDWQSDNLRWSADRLIVRFEDRYYVVGMTDEYLNYVAGIGPDNVMKVVCEFGQEQKPAESVVVANDKAVCDAVLSGGLDYVPFDKLHAVTVRDLQHSPIAQWHPAEMAAEADIDNDGRPDHVFVTQLASGAGRGCDSYGLALLNDERTALADSQAAKLLLSTGGECGGTRVLPFRFHGKTYLESKYAEGHPTNVHAVFKIEDGRRDLICRFQARVVNTVLSRYNALVRAARDSYKNPWEYAFEQPGLKDVELLIKSGRDVNEPISSGMSVLNWAVWRHRDDLLELLLKNGADPNRKYPRYGISPLMEAIWRGTDESVAILLRHGAKLNIGNSDPIEEAVNYGYVSKLKVILKAGVRPEQKHLDLARQRRNSNPEIIRMLEAALKR